MYLISLIYGQKILVTSAGEVMFSSVFISVRQHHYPKTTEPVSIKVCGGMGPNPSHFGLNPD